MIIALDRLASSLESALEPDSVNRESGGLTARALGGNAVALVCSPSTPQQVATILRICAEAKAPVIPWGGGTGLNVGNPPRAACVAINLSRLNRMVEHDHANLTVTVQSGMTLAALREHLSSQQQFLPFDPPYPGKASIGGTVALNMNGPRRGFYGGVRDLVIGMKVALITGEQIKAGGKVVKNVAGYDMCKLFTGSLGTLGVITEVTARVAPVAETAATVTAAGTFKAAAEFVELLSRSPLLPVAVVLMNSQNPEADKAWQVAVWCEGQPENVTRHLFDADTLAQRLGLGTATLRDRAHGDLWESVRDFPLGAERCVYRATLPRAEIVSFIEALSQTRESLAAIIIDTVMGTVWLSLPATSEAATVWLKLISLAAAHRGHVVMFAAPHQFKGERDVWGPPPPAHWLMRKIKQQFDPDGLLNPGRFIGGI